MVEGGGVVMWGVWGSGKACKEYNAST